MVVIKLKGTTTIFRCSHFFHRTMIIGGRVSISKSKRFTREMYDKVVTFVCLEELGMTRWPPSFPRFYLSIFQEGSSLGCPVHPKKHSEISRMGVISYGAPKKVALWMGNWGYNIYILDMIFCLVIVVDGFCTMVIYHHFGRICIFGNLFQAFETEIQLTFSQIPTDRKPTEVTNLSLQLGARNPLKKLSGPKRKVVFFQASCFCRCELLNVGWCILEVWTICADRT